MTMDDKQLDNLFRSKLEGFEQNPPEWVWDAIQERLAEKRRRKFFVWFRYAGVAALVLLAFFVGNELRTEHPTSPTQLVKDEKRTEQNRTVKTQENGEEISGEKEVREHLPQPERPFMAGLGSETATVMPDHSAHPAQTELSSARLEQTLRSPLVLISKRTARLENVLFDTDGLIVRRRTDQTSQLSESDRQIMAQNALRFGEKPAERKSKEWTVGAMVAPAVSVRQASYSSDYSSSMNYANGKSALNFGGGLVLAMNTDSRWSVQTGVQYSRLSQNSSNSPVRKSNLVYDAAPEADGLIFYSTGVAEGSNVVIYGPAGTIVMQNLPQSSYVTASLETASESATVMMTSAGFEQQFDYVEIPLTLRYQLLSRSYDVQLMAGLSTGFLVRNVAYLSKGGKQSRIGETSDMRTVTYSPNLGLGFGYKLSPQLQLRFEPSLRYYIQSLSSNSDVNYRPYTFSFYTGITYSF